MTEVWKPIPSYEGLYEVSNFGNVRSLDRLRTRKVLKGRILKQNFCNSGYLHVNLSKRGNHKTIMVHRIVAKVFVDNDDEKKKIAVNHIDGNKTNNNASNLEWCTYSDNQKHAYKNGLNSWNKTKGKKPKGVIQLDKDTSKEIARYESIGEALRAINAPPSHTSLVNCCNKKKHYNTFHGYKWEWIENMLGAESEE